MQSRVARVHVDLVRSRELEVTLTESDGVSVEAAAENDDLCVLCDCFVRVGPGVSPGVATVGERGRGLAERWARLVVP